MGELGSVRGVGVAPVDRSVADGAAGVGRRVGAGDGARAGGMSAACAHGFAGADGHLPSVTSSEEGSTVPDLAFVLLTLALFGVLMFVVRGAEKV
jgi:hypothetical protein